VPARCCPDMKAADLHGSFVLLPHDRCGLAVAASDDIIDSVALDAEGARSFMATVGDLDDRKPLRWDRALHRPDSFFLSCRVGPRDCDRPIRCGLVAFSDGRISDGPSPTREGRGRSKGGER
jgi:hypothetical protein